jgi:hypothetical protein
MKLAHLSNDEVMAQLKSICSEGNRVLARLIVVLIEVEARRMHLEAACPSMFDFCVRKLGMSEGEAFRRLNAARLVARFPEILGQIERGEIHLSALQLLAKHLTPDNVAALTSAAAGKTKAEVQALIAERAPSSDVLPIIRTVPATEPVSARTEDVEEPQRARVAPLSATRHELRLTISAEQREKLERARDLMMHANPRGDLAAVLERGLDLLLAKLEKERLGKAVRPRARSASKRTSRAVRREVFARDGSQCTYVSESGERCPARSLLELDHVEARALGGRDDATNLRVRCRAHNRLHAERVFGKERVARAIHFSQEKETLRAAARGLTNMGFRSTDAKRALTTVMGRHPGAIPPLGDVVREALSLLT